MPYMSLKGSECQVSKSVHSDTSHVTRHTRQPPRAGLTQDRASPNFMGLASLGLDVGTFGNLLYSVLLLDVNLGLDL
jgi:hypothetical protein